MTTVRITVTKATPACLQMINKHDVIEKVGGAPLVKLQFKPSRLSGAAAEAVKQHQKHVDASFTDLSSGIFLLFKHLPSQRSGDIRLS